MVNSNYYVVIMAGGIGSRFWPSSRTNYPKQFLDILGTGKTLIQQTLQRFEGICPIENIYVITNESYKELMFQQLPQLDESQIIFEPVMRNTAPCIAYACHKINAKNPNAVVVVAPSDHLILEENTFRYNITEALELASQKDYLITLGIVPSRPDTGYGYIQYGEKGAEGNFFKVTTFTEKPNLELAKTFVESGEFLWNAGIFVWNTKTILNAFENFTPEINSVFKEGESFFNTNKEVEFINKAYQCCTNISIDYAIMERANNVYVRPSEFGWSDLGTWQSVYLTSENKDYLGNIVENTKSTILYDTENTIVKSEKGKLIVLQGLKDCIVVDSKDVLFVGKRKDESKIKDIMADIKILTGNKYL